ncbi:MAG TPA: hypothetical protein VGM17_16235, partial [Rhizomicrobium sp.]
GRHVAAIAPNGKGLWLRNPFADLTLCPYRNLRPIIVRIGLPRPEDLVIATVDRKFAKFWYRHPSLILIEYDSSQRIFVDEKTGVSIFGGNN